LLRFHRGITNRLSIDLYLYVGNIWYGINRESLVIIDSKHTQQEYSGQDYPDFVNVYT
jgi:hypothetical protein